MVCKGSIAYPLRVVRTSSHRAGDADILSEDAWRHVLEGYLRHQPPVLTESTTTTSAIRRCPTIVGGRIAVFVDPISAIVILTRAFGLNHDEVARPPSTTLGTVAGTIISIRKTRDVLVGTLSESPLYS
jgi:hypothetical protein